MAKRTRYDSRPRPAAKRASKPAAPATGAASAPLTGANSGLIRHGDHYHERDDTPMRTSASLTEAEIARAAELEAEANARERAAIAESLRRRARGRSGETDANADPNTPLSVRMAHEYAYVSRDVKRIALTAGLMVSILSVLHVLVNVLGVISL